MEWIKIETDRYGNISKETKKEMRKHKFIAIRRYSKIFETRYYVYQTKYIIDRNDFSECTHYLPIPTLEEDKNRHIVTNPIF